MDDEWKVYEKRLLSGIIYVGAIIWNKSLITFGGSNLDGFQSKIGVSDVDGLKASKWIADICRKGEFMQP